MVSAFLEFCLCLWHLVDGTDAVTSVMEGESVSLNTGVTEVQNYHLIQWMFGETQIAEINNLIKSSSIYGTDDDKTLKHRLKLDPQTGSLTITHTRTTDSGLYQLILTSGETRSKSFRVTVSGVFGADELKSVMEGDSVTLNPDLTQIKKFYLLEWRFGDSVIARIDEKDISYPSPTEIFRDRLQLDETGSLTIKNMKARLSGLYELQIRHSAGISKGKFNVTVHDCTRCCDTFEAAIRLVVAAVVGVAAVAVLVYDIRSTRSEQHRKRFTIKPTE
uniref:Immunoglobulin domain-containing protein n=1 Tax=Cyprinus carpio TaxID=7962 RepID=A0A8C2BJY9_CYPCA